MSTIYFISGVGVGCAMSAITLFVFVSKLIRSSVEGSKEEREQQHEETAELMRERNRLDELKIETMKEIAQVMRNQ